MMPVGRLIYFSECRIDPVNDSVIGQISDILETAYRFNQLHGITGALIFDTEWFVQVLEGERDAVWPLFQRIAADRRHSRVTPVEITWDARRQFGDWWMGWSRRTTHDAAIFAPRLRNGRFRPDEMCPSELLALLIDLKGANLVRDRDA
jgi:Sensors of blue-light using FAD